MSPINWAEVLVSALSSAGILAGFFGALGLILRGAIVKFIDRRLDAKFDLEMKRHEIGIENLKTFAEHARKIISLFPTLIANLRTAARTIADANPATEANASDLRVAVKELDAKLAEYFLVLPPDTHEAIHACKEAGVKVLSALQRGTGEQLTQSIDAFEFRRREALTGLRNWAESMGTLFPQLH